MSELTDFKTNIQLFRYNNEFSERFFNIFYNANLVQQKYLFKIIDEFERSYMYGQFIYDNNLCDLVQFFTRDYFSKNWGAMLSALKIAGTFESYIQIIKSAIGSETEIKFDVPDKSHLIINITNTTEKKGWSAISNHNKFSIIPSQTQYADKKMAFKVSIGQLTINETLKLIELLNVNSIFIEVIFAK